MRYVLVFTIALGAGGVARAQQLRPFCPDRPGLGTPACTIDPGHAAVEIGAADWTVERDRATRTETLLAGDLLLRYGIDDRLEAQIGWTAFGHVRQRDRRGGAIGGSSGTGDLSIALRRNLSNPDGSGFSAALMPFASIPIGGAAIGAGDWGGGLTVPVSYGLSDKIAIAASPRIEAAVDGDRHGRHLSYGSVVGLNLALSDQLGAAVEFQAIRDEDPGGHTTQTLAGLSAGWQPKDGFQLDIGAIAGMNSNSPDLELYLGIARRF